MKRIRSMIALLVVLVLCCFSVYAHEVPDESRTGTITVEMTYNGNAVLGGELTAYRIGEIHEDDGNFSFVKTVAMAEFPQSYEDINSAELAKEIAAFVAQQEIPPYASAQNSDGKAVFADLELGLYLIVQTERSAGYEPLNSFLVSVPMCESGHYIYEINAEGKFQPIQEIPPTEPPTPDDPKLPQTGQLNWPVPLMALFGMFLILAGWILRSGGKKARYEK